MSQRLLASLLLSIFIFSGCSSSSGSDSKDWKRPEPDYSKPATYVHEWNRLLIEIIKVDGFTPGSAARNYSYTNIAAYLAALPAYPECVDLAGQLNGVNGITNND